MDSTSYLLTLIKIIHEKDMLVQEFASQIDGLKSEIAQLKKEGADVAPEKVTNE